ncbi:MAG TPA: phosphoribosyltransferase family protein [Actinoplanes sp.]|nr:phosphoribosyltransferase family protein [Actinoplanes sp.]
MSEIPGMWTRTGMYVLTWTDFGSCVTWAAERVRADGFEPTVICAVARGGLTAAAYLATVLDVPSTHTVRVRRTESDDRYAAKQAPVLEVVSPARIGPEDRVLIVDDIVGTGATEKVVREHLSDLGAGQVRSVALVRNHRSPLIPDYCPVVLDDWIVFPWEHGWADLAESGRRVAVGAG